MVVRISFFLVAALLQRVQVSTRRLTFFKVVEEFFFLLLVTFFAGK